jgi:phosphohistidine phosphatase
MKKLLIMRHAKSDWSEPGVADHDRGLNARGLRDAPAMGIWLREKSVYPSFILCSSAKRTRQTAKLVSSELYRDRSLPDIHTEESLYLAGTGRWLETISLCDQQHDVVLVIGHNPGLENLVYELTRESLFLPTAAIVVADCPLESWDDIRSIRATTNHIWRPKEIGEKD